MFGSFLCFVLKRAFLFFFITGKSPSIDKPFSAYPLLVSPISQPSKKTLVVQSFAFGKYLGNLKVKFDKKGNVERYSGNPILLNSNYPRDPDIMKQVEGMSKTIKTYFKVIHLDFNDSSEFLA